MYNQVKEFINRRFPSDSDWLTGNCYFFAVVLRSRFGGEIVYDPIEGHFYCVWKMGIMTGRGADI